MKKQLERILALIAITATSLIIVDQAEAKTLPAHVGECVKTRVSEVMTRLAGVPDSGSAISFTNGGYQVSYDKLPAVDHSKSGDSVIMCLVKLPKNCPPGDNRGRVYHVTNQRTKKSWTLPDSEHICGGA